MAIEQPVLWVGTVGFTPPERERLQLQLQQRPEGWPQWRMAKFAEADAWMICGQRVTLTGSAALTAFGAEPGEAAVQLKLDEVDRPLAFTLPLAATEFEPMYTFKVKNESSVRAVLQQFEGWLRPLRAQFALASGIIDRERELKAGVYHVSQRGSLLAVIDLNEWWVSLSPLARPVDFDEASWERRPAVANSVPSHFLKLGLTHLMWCFAQRTGRDVLPPRYRSGPIYFLRPPRVPMRLLKDSQLQVLRELATASGDLVDLAGRTGLAADQLARDLASLYFAGALTSDQAYAAKPGETALDSLGLSAALATPLSTPIGLEHLRPTPN